MRTWIERHARALVGLALALLLAQFLGLGLVQAWEDAPTYDEPLTMVAGYAALERRDLRINPEHPPLPKVLAALPPYALRALELPYGSEAWARADGQALALEAWQGNWPGIRRIAFLFRIAPLLWTAGAGLLLFALGRRLFGAVAGLLSAALWLTLPLVLGFGHLDGLDTAAAFTALLVPLALARWLDRRRFAALLGVGLACGAALLTRAAVGPVLLGGACLALLLADGWRPGPRALGRAALCALLAWAVLWLGYAALDPAGLLEPAFPMPAAPSSRLVRVLLRAPWPAGFEAGLRFLSAFHGQGGAPGYLLGRCFEGAPWWFWPASLLYKLPPATALLLPLGLLGWRRLEPSVRRRAALLILPPLLGLCLLMAFAQRPYGARYLLPHLALLLLAAGPLVGLLRGRRGLVALGLALALQQAELWASHPLSLAWVSPLYPVAWRGAADADADWGQDLWRLQAWSRGRQGVYAAWFGFGPSFELREVPGLRSAYPNGPWGPPRPPEPDTEWVVAGATVLNAFQGGPLPGLRAWCPVERIGGSLLAWRFDGVPSELLEAEPRAGLPAALCPGRTWSAPIGAR